MGIGADLVVLAVDERSGTVRMANVLGYALAAADLVELADRRRIEATMDGVLQVTETLRIGDRVLDRSDETRLNSSHRP